MTDAACLIDLRLGPTTPIELDLTIEAIDLVVSPSSILLNVDADPIDLTVAPEEIRLEITGVGSQGPQGEPGADGVGSVVETAEAGETISALKPVVILDGIASVASSSNAAHKGFVAGIATTAATIGNSVSIQTAGRLQDASWNWDVSLPWLFVGNGVLTQTPPSSGWVQSIARVESSDTVFIQVLDVITRI